MKNNLISAVALAVLSAAFAASAGDAFTYKITVNNLTEETLAFGRLQGASDGIDSNEYPMAPMGIPEMDMTYLYFPGMAYDNIGNTEIDPYMTKLGGDFKDASTTSSVWRICVDSVHGDTFKMNWSLTEGAVSTGAKLTLKDLTAGKEVNMLTASSATVGCGVYEIAYLAPGADKNSVPPVLDDQEITEVFYAGREVSVTLLSPELAANYEALNFSILYYNNGVLVPVENLTRGNTLQYEDGILTFDLKNGTYDQVMIYFDVRSKTDSNAGISKGLAVLNESSEPMVSIKSVQIGGTPSANKNKVRVTYTDATKTAYQDISAVYNVVVPDSFINKEVALSFKFPARKYDGTSAIEDYNALVDGENPVTVFPHNIPAIPEEGESTVSTLSTAYTFTKNSIDFELYFRMGTNAKGGDLNFSMAYDEGTVLEPENAVIKIVLEGDGTLDIDGDGFFTTDDDNLVYKFIIAYLGTQNPFTGVYDVNKIVKSQLFSDVALSAEQADAAYEALLGLFESGKLDVDEDNFVNTDDSTLVYNFVKAYLGTQNPFTGVYDPEKVKATSVVEGLDGKDAELCLENLKALLPID